MKQMRFLLTISLCLFFLSGMTQKVKYKKDKILIDKKEAYKFERNGEVLSMDFEISTLKDEKLLIFRDSILNYTQLPYEKKPRLFMRLTSIYSPELDREVLVFDIPPFGVRPNIVRALNETNFFKTGTVTDGILDRLNERYNYSYDIDHEMDILAATDKRRKEVYEKSVALFGEYTPRNAGGNVEYENGTLNDGLTNVGFIKLIKKTKEDETYENDKVRIYAVLNSDSKRIGTITESLPNSTLKLETIADERLKQYSYKGKDKNEVYLEITEYLIANAYL